MARARGWKCRRQTAGAVCGTFNRPGTRKCSSCGKPRPPKRRARHLQALELSYEHFKALNGGERCAICERGPGSRRLDRDHDHTTGRPRGLLCARCNRALPNWMTSAWLRAAAAYLERTA
jgi:hypothetical protein